MVCEKCEKKLSKAAVPEVWKEGSRSAGAGRDGGRSVARNTMLKSNTGFAPHLKTCRVCKTKLSQDAAYCNQCAFSKGICAMCGVSVFPRFQLPSLKRHCQLLLSATNYRRERDSTEQ